MVRVYTFYPNKIKMSVTIDTKDIENVQDKKMRCYGSDIEECSAEYMKRGMKL